MMSSVSGTLFTNLNYNETAQLFMAFSLGVVLSPFSTGIKWFLLFIILYEVLYGYMVKFQMPYWRPLGRLGIFCASILGWILGRYAVQKPLK